MRKGLVVGETVADAAFSGVVESVQQAESLGFDSAWMANIFGLDAISTMGHAGANTTRIEVGTAVTPTYPRHPTAIAQQALTSGTAAGGRFSLGIGLSHKLVIEDMFGFSYDKPARHMSEYLSVLAPLLRGETVSFFGKQYNVNNVTLDFAGRQPVPLLVAALGPRMLKLAGEMSDGTITWMTGPKTLETHIIPTINKSASAAGKGEPRVVASFPVLLTSDADGAKQMIAKSLEVYGMLPSYRAMLDREGVEGPADLAIAGDEASLRAGIRQLADIGVTDFSAAIVTPDAGERQRTLEFLASESM